MSMMLSAPGYRLIRKIGAGGFGKVFLAVDGTGTRQVAIKFLLTVSPDALQRFRREVVLLHRNKSNPHVVRIFSWDLDWNPPYIVMEYCRGGSLRGWVGAARQWQPVVAALGHAVRGLDLIHRNGGFHRDLKPDNLLITDGPQPHQQIVKVSDFGLARDPTATANMTRSPAGTPGYMAPELMLGHPFTSKADVYSLGITGVELLTGVRDPSGLLAVPIPARLRDLIVAMTSHRPEDRPDLPVVAGILAELLREPQAAVPASGQRTGTGAGTAAVLGLVGGGLLLAGLAAALGGRSRARWDPSVERYRAADGRFVPG